MAAVCGAVALGPPESGVLRLAAARSDLEGNEWLGEVQLCTATAAEGLTVVNRKRMRSGVTCVVNLEGAGAAAGSSMVAAGCDSGDAFLVRLSHSGEAEDAAAADDDEVEFDYSADADDVMGCHDNVVSCVAAMAGGEVVTASWDGTAALWSPGRAGSAGAGVLAPLSRCGKPTSSMRLFCCAAGPAGSVILGGEAGASAWDPRAGPDTTGRLAAAVGVTAAASCGEWVTALGFAHGAVGAVDARAVGRGMLLWAPHCHRGEVRSLTATAAAAPGGMALVSGGECGIVRVTTFDADAAAGSIGAAAVSAATSRAEAVVAVGFSSGSKGAWLVSQDGAFSRMD